MTFKELYILLSDKCNFSCAHCLNSSGPKSTRWMIDANEIEDLANTINSDPNINRVHFTGGEPTLFVDQIQSLQSKITKDVEYSVTSNGSFWSDPSAITKKIKLDEFILSWDRFHAPFIKKENLIFLAKTLKEQGYKVLVNLVLVDAEDLGESFDFSSQDIEVLINGAVRSGRYSMHKIKEDYRDSESANRRCPSLSSTVEVRGSEKVNFLPKEGYTPCGGPLVFDRLANKEFLYTKTYKNYSQNKLKERLMNKSFSDQFKELGFTIYNEQFESACSACVALYGKNGDLPSVFELSQLETSPNFFKTDRYLKKSFEDLIMQKFNLGYLYQVTKEILESNIQHVPVQEQISEITVTSDNADLVVQSIKEDYFEAFKNFVDPKEVENFETKTLEYLSSGGTGIVYKKNDKVVGCVLLNRFEEHPFAHVPAVHVGYGGYKYSALNKLEIKHIKNSWIINALKLHQEGDVICSSAYCFNVRSLNFFKRLGFYLIGARCDFRKSK